MSKRPFHKQTIYYFSGTGNARSVAKWIKQTSESKHVETELVDIGRLEKRNVQHVSKNTLIGFCAPTHGFNFPPIMLHFILRFPKAKQNQVFLINTRAGMKFGKHFLPGLSGIALLLSSLILMMKGYKVIGLRSIDLPSNWISLHPGMKPSTIESIFIKRKEDTIDFATKLLAGKRVYSAFKDIVQDILISPIAVGYYLIGRFVFAKSFIASKDCSRCDLCIKKCPVNAIKIVDNRCFWTHKCESCMQCMNICPQRSIETVHGFIFGISYLIYAVILVWLYKLLSIENLAHHYFAEGVSKPLLLIFDSVIYLLLLILGYRIMHFLLRFKLFERLFVLTSLTTYKFWRRYKPSKKYTKITVEEKHASGQPQ